MTERRRVFISGAGAGIGWAVAKRFSQEPVRLALLERDEEALERATVELRQKGIDVLPLRADQSSPTDIIQAFAKIEQTYGGLDVAINNAGALGPAGTAAEIDEEGWTRTIDINLNGTWRCLSQELKMMLPRGTGVICNMGSIWGLAGGREQPAYVASKHGIIGLTRAAALDHARSGVRINAVCPGTIATPLTIDWLAGDKDFANRTMALKPIGRLGQPEEIANSVYFLCSSEASFMHGACMVVDGAETVGPAAAQR